MVRNSRLSTGLNPSTGPSPSLNTAWWIQRASMCVWISGFPPVFIDLFMDFPTHSTQEGFSPALGTGLSPSIGPSPGLSSDWWIQKAPNFMNVWISLVFIILHRGCMDCDDFLRFLLFPLPFMACIGFLKLFSILCMDFLKHSPNKKGFQPKPRHKHKPKQRPRPKLSLVDTESPKFYECMDFRRF